MRTTMDKAGRIVIPAALRDRLGIVPGPVELIMDGTGIRIEVETHDNVVEEDGLLVINGGPVLTDEDVRELRLGDQR